MRPYRKKRELSNWIRRRLGSPIVDVVIDSTQIDDCIDQACDYFGEHAGGIGNENTIVLICPEPVLYDGTGSPCQPGPKAGRWRKPVTTNCFGSSGTSGTSGVGTSGTSGIGTSGTSGIGTSGTSGIGTSGTSGVGTSGTTGIGTTGTTGTTACPPVNCGAVNTGHIPAPLGNCTNPMPTFIGDTCCPEESECRGPGWCGDGIQSPHCFTETEKGDPDVSGPYWVEGDTTAKPSKQGFIFKSVYDVPSDIMAVQDHLGVGYFGTGAYQDSGEALFSPMHLLLGGGGSWGMQSPTAWVDGRYGYWHGAHGGFVDVVGWEMGMQYLEMFRTLYSIKMQVQLMELQHKVRITPPPSGRGVIAFAATRKVADEYLYEHQFVREYAFALCALQVGINGSKYTGVTFPGGGTINSEFYVNMGKELREKLEEQIRDGTYSFPPDFYIG